MKHLLLALGLLLAGPASGGAEHRVLRDEARGRDVPVKIAAPDADGEETLRPAVVFSHGLGGSVGAAGYLADALVQRGYVFVNLQHPGSDESVWKDVPRWRRMAAMRAAANAQQAVARPLDASFVLTELLADPTLRIDPGRVGVAGHSFGAFTVQALLGQRFPGGVSFADPRFAAALHLSGQAVRDPADLAGVTAPFLSITGTRDTSPISADLKPADRRSFFEHAPAPHRYLIVYDAADHFVFGGNAGPVRADRDAALDAHVQRSVAAAAVLFFDAFLAEPVEPLPVEALRAVVGPGDRVEAR